MKNDIEATDVPTKPYTDQKPGTSGLRKKVTVFQQEHYVENFVQSTLNVVRRLKGRVPDLLVIGGDGRYFVEEAVQTILSVAAGNGVPTVVVGLSGLLSTPAVSVIMRRRYPHKALKGAFILTASHNPGGPKADFGIKYNTENGGPAQETITDAVYEETLKIATLHVALQLPPKSLTTTGPMVYKNITIEVIDPLEDYVAYMREIFDFAALKKLLERPDFTVHIDSMHGASGPYVRAIFHECLGVPLSSLHRTDPLPDFGGGHPDPNLTYAHELVHAMGLLPDGSVDAAARPADAKVPSFGAAFDGDADRNMILGARFFVNPSDSLAVLVANADVVPFFQQAGGLRTVARSMPTSGAVDRVAEAKHLKCFEVPTGWKYFGNLMDSETDNYNPLLCGEESFGTGSNHIREKDGVWAALFWLSVLAARNPDPAAALVGVQDVVEDHWRTYGRNYYSRYDYENVATEAAAAVMARVGQTAPAAVPALSGRPCVTVDNFEYTDPVDHAVAKKQGLRVLFDDGSRFVLRLSGTGSSGATVRLYLEQYMSPTAVSESLAQGTLPTAGAALKELIEIALQVSDIRSLTGRDTPTVIT